MQEKYPNEPVLGFEPALVKELIANEELAKDIRKKLEALRKVTSSYPMLTVKRLREEE